MGTVLVTGGCGYIGGQLIRDLALEGVACIRILDNLSQGGPRALLDLPETGHYEFVEGDILNPGVVRAALKGVDTVIHLAAIVHTPMGYENPTWVEQVNHWGTARLVEACLAADVQHFIYASSIAVYGPSPDRETGMQENDICRPVGPYARSKRHAEESVIAASKRGLRTTILRFGVVYGQAPNMRFEAVANRFVLLAGTKRSLTIYGEGTQRRPFIHTQDASRAVCFCMLKSEKLTQVIYNAVGENASVLDVADAVRTTFPNAEMRYADQDVQTQLNFVVDGQALRNAGWHPEYSLHDGIREMGAHLKGFEPFSVLSH